MAGFEEVGSTRLRRGFAVCSSFARVTAPPQSGGFESLTSDRVRRPQARPNPLASQMIPTDFLDEARKRRVSACRLSGR